MYTPSALKRQLSKKEKNNLMPFFGYSSIESLL
jgi:hypothetical protein